MNRQTREQIDSDSESIYPMTRKDWKENRLPKGWIEQDLPADIAEAEYRAYKKINASDRRLMKIFILIFVFSIIVLALLFFYWIGNSFDDSLIYPEQYGPKNYDFYQERDFNLTL